jgi:hypothetical protein
MDAAAVKFGGDRNAHASLPCAWEYRLRPGANGCDGSPPS